MQVQYVKAKDETQSGMLEYQWEGQYGWSTRVWSKRARATTLAEITKEKREISDTQIREEILWKLGMLKSDVITVHNSDLMHFFYLRRIILPQNAP